MYKYSHGTDFYRKDAQGNICALLDSNGNVVVRYVYDAWGNHAVLDANGADITDVNHIGVLNPFRYRGYFYDEETGLYFLKTRYYDPEIGRFITIDGIEYLDPETINGLNLYAYCGNNPVIGYDPDGTWDWAAFWQGLGMILTAIAAVAVSIATFGAATPIAMGIIAGVTLGAGVLTGINGVATMVEAGTGYNFVRDGVFQGNVNAYNLYAGITEGVAIVGTVICGVWRVRNAPRIKAYKNIQNYEFTETLLDATHLDRPYQQSILFQKQLIKYGKMIKEKRGVYKFIAKGSYRIGYGGKVHNGITWKIVVDIINELIMHIGPF